MSRPNRIGRYHVDDVWREEPLGRIARARVPEFDRAVFVRELVPPFDLPLEAAARVTGLFRDECRLLGQLSHPAVERAYDVGETEDGTHFLVYERPDAGGYHPLTEVTRSLSAEAAVSVAAELAGALAFLTAAGVPCGVFTPADVWVSTNGRVRLLHLSFSSLALQAGMTGLPVPHLAPEVSNGSPLSERALVYSLASWLYRVLAPNALSPEETAAAGREPDPLWTQNPSIRAAVDETLQASLAREPARRPASLNDLAARLRPAGEAVRPVVSISDPLPRTELAPSTGAEAETEELPPLVRYAGWTAGLTVAGGMAGWLLAQLFPPR